jgi:hypothetical protein
VPPSHSLALRSKCGGPSQIVMPPKMTHNEFEVYQDLVKPIKSFLTDNHIGNTVTKSPSVAAVGTSVREPPFHIQRLLTSKDDLKLMEELLLKLYEEPKIEESRMSCQYPDRGGEE